MMILRISQAAREDILRSAQWYDAQPSRYGSAFLDEVEQALKEMTTNPQLHPPVEDGIQGFEIREYFIERFQQRVIFLVRDREMIVISVVHASRREGSWHRHIDKRDK